MNNEYKHNYNTIASMIDILNVLKSICKHNQGKVRSIKINADNLNETYLQVRKSFSFWIKKYRYKCVPGFMAVLEEYAKIVNAYNYNYNNN